MQPLPDRERRNSQTDQQKRLLKQAKRTFREMPPSERNAAEKLYKGANGIRRTERI